ncbi:hypothetical protein JD844_013505 [Phrynosoma platyrhinos]|uniref:F-box/LRR-repeat protein n=1 Tax=Phrynosoma platyrhinos TaxID=52577 RepID=A0ABQ7TKX2_PHRPL|nr:hypothetical protein JD844_013505 [Phrynosoma platyrhinos]
MLILFPRQNLSSLNLHGCKQLPADALVCLVESLPHLITLDLSKTHCNRQVLSAIGATCQQLRDLNLSLCKRLSLKSLMYLAYDPLGGSFSCQKLRALRVWGLKASKGHCLALIFVLLALPRLTYFVDNSIAKAVCLIHVQRFGNSRMPPGFPSLTELVQRRMNINTEEGISGLTLALSEITILRESPLSLINAMCPYLTKMTLFLGDRAAFTNTSLSWRYLTRLTIICDIRRDLSELFPVAENLGSQLRSLTIRHFDFTDEFSFHHLLSHCTRLQELEGSFFSPKKQFHGLQMDIDTLDWDFCLPCLEFPQLSLFILEYSDVEKPLPYRHAMVLRQSLVNLLKHSPCLKFLTLRCMPFSLDRVFRRVLNPPNTALRNIDEITLSQTKVSMDVINLILSSENKLSYLGLLKCPGIHSADYSTLLHKIDKEAFDMIVEWKCPS